VPHRPPVFRHAWQPTERQAKAEYARLRQVRDPWRHLYYSDRWRKTRSAVLRAQPICMRCKQAPSTTVHHVVPHRGDEHLFWSSPLQAVCRSCHSSVCQSEEARDRGAE
jgi:5-methylcytosine-specific restriction protein A